MSEFNHHSTEEPVCPHCGKEQSDSWEWGDDETGQVECESCGREFAYTLRISYSWTTRKDLECHHCRGRGRMPNGITCPECQGKRRIPNEQPKSDQNS